MESVNGKVIKKAGGKAKREAEGRPVAVDWALSKEKWQETQKVERVDGEGVSGSRSSASSSEEDSEGSDDSSSGDDEAEYDEDEVDGDDAMEEDEPVKPQLPTVDVGSTLFIRNLPFETTQQELNTLYEYLR